MPRHARRYGRSGIYHVIMRGINRQVIFEEPGDYKKFVSILAQNSRETNATVYAYCLMHNHIHLLLGANPDTLPLLMKKLGVRYAAYYNAKYERVGHLFQDRYKSEPIEDRVYFLTVFRYILNNPYKAGICPARDYLWSSYSLYGRKDSFVDTEYLQELIGDYAAFESFIAQRDGAAKWMMEFDRDRRRDDAGAEKQINEILAPDSVNSLQTFPAEKRDAVLKELYQAGLSMRQIARITGFSRGVVEKACR